ncbi:TRAP-type C4-dicarboxylate transport system, substrate-binding protein [Oryzisolibacter propanilivorax]|uniref:TRAP-type C4-dicarboxylate transport system, substrate-binding protein n=1 Tax=Oryzisolibacter propanilivorax TaxID=1527607 RepID=A0A1G9T119_9BURK|nr:TRAP transporter substrate-binding protein [Oryzisolibacter propanilivorax]SDM41433.1 TRAP-type C4-dicarboxylate transport system, substrate-binding protein [Oryzisolibacter propanilivorax]
MHKKILTALALAAGAMAAQAQQPVVLKVAHFWPPTALSQQKVLEPWCAKIAKESNNELQCQIYPAMQLGGTPAQLIQQAIDGVADIVWTLPGYTAGRFPSMEVMELPFLTKDAEGGSRAAWAIYEKYGQKDFAGVKPLAFHVHDRGQIHNNKRPITKVSDLKGLKMRAPTRLTNMMVAALGATPVAMPMPQTPDAVSKGVVDGYVLPWEVIPTMKLHEMTKYHSEINPPQPGLYTTLFTIAMNQAKYDSLPPHLKKVIDANSGADFSASIGRAWDESAPPARKQAIEHGNQFNTIGAAEVEGFQKATASVADRWVKEVTAKGYDGKGMLEMARTLSAK